MRPAQRVRKNLLLCATCDCEQDPEQHRKPLSIALYNYGKCLREARRIDEACTMWAEDVVLCRACSSGIPGNIERGSLTHRKINDGISLQEAQRHDEDLNHPLTFPPSCLLPL